MLRFIFALLCVPLVADADIGAGELAGFRLGDQFDLVATTPTKAIGDRSVRIAASSSQLPSDADALYLYTTPGSHIIGKIVIQRLAADEAEAERIANELKFRWEAANPDWERLESPVPFGRRGGAMVGRLRQGIYALFIFYRPIDEGYAVAVELEFDSRSAERKAWRRQIKAESAAKESG